MPAVLSRPAFWVPLPIAVRSGVVSVRAPFVLILDKIGFPGAELFGLVGLFLQAVAAVNFAMPLAFRARDQLAVDQEKAVPVAEGADHGNVVSISSMTRCPATHV